MIHLLSWVFKRIMVESRHKKLEVACDEKITLLA
jgi:hypothetical protein